jgi:hypothetical protein
MYNKKTLTNIVKNLGSAKAPIKKRDIIYDPMGQWTNPGQDTRVPTPNGNITMGANPETGQPIPFPVFAQPNVGPGVMMQPGQDYTFPGAKYVDEFPQVKKGGLVRQSKKYSKSLMAKNILFVKNALLKKKKSVKNKIFDPNSPYFKEGGAFEIELDDAEIDQYRKGGYIVEELDAYVGGGEPCEQGFDRDPVTGECVSTMGQTERVQRIEEVPTNQYSKYINAYEEANPRGMYVYQKKADYLNKNKGLNKMAGLSQDNFNTDVEGNFNSNWEYNRNSEVIKQFAKDNGINPNNHVELVEKMADKGNVSRDMIANSKYGSKLQPSLWARSLAGAQELGNFIVKQLPGEQGDVFNKQIKGLTKKEWDEIHNSGTGALETLAVTDIPGAIIANSIADLSTASGGNFQESPGLLSGELKSNVDPTAATLLNPFLYAGLGQGMAAAPKIAAGVLNMSKGAKNLVKGVANYGNDIIQTSKQAGKFELPKYSSTYRVEHAGFNTPASSDKLTGRWFVDNPKEVEFYVDKLKDPVTGVELPFGEKNPVRIMRERLPEYKIKEQFGAGMPEKARTRSMGRGNFTDAGLDDLLGSGAGERFTKGKYIDSDYNAMESAPFLFRQEEGILGADRVNQLRAGTNQGRFSSGTTTTFDNQLDAIKNLKDEQKIIDSQSIIKQFLPFKEGGYIDLDLDEDQINEYKNGGYIVEDISIPSLTRMDDGAQVKGSQGLNADFSTNLTAFINAAKADGIDLGIGSGFRSVEKQKQLWEQALKKYGSPEKARKWVAPPGKSNHNKGIAVDLSSSGVFLGKNKNTKATQWAHANAEKYGLHFRMGWEPWHIEPLNLSKEQKAKIDAEHQHSDNEDPNAHVDPNNAEALSKEGIDMTKYYQNLEKEQEITDIDNDYSNWNPQQEVVVDPKVEQLNAYSKLMSPSIQNVNDMYAATKMNQQQQQKQFAMGGYIDTELTDKEITNYKNGGYIVEYLD